MTFENIPIRPCCKYMEDTLMMNDIRRSVVFSCNEHDEWRFAIVWADGDCVPLRFCPSCGKTIEEIELKEDEDEM